MLQAYAIPGLKERPKLFDDDKVDRIITTTVEYYEQDIEKVKGRRRFRRPTWCRQVCMYMLRKKTLLTLEEIASQFGGRDHTTTVHSIQTVKAIMQTNEWLRNEVLVLEDIIDKNTWSSNKFPNLEASFV